MKRNILKREKSSRKFCNGNIRIEKKRIGTSEPEQLIRKRCIGNSVSDNSVSGNSETGIPYRKSSKRKIRIGKIPYRKIPYRPFTIFHDKWYMEKQFSKSCGGSHFPYRPPRGRWPIKTHPYQTNPHR